MLDLEAIVRRAVRTIGAGPVGVAALFDAPERLIHDLAAESVVCGYIANGAPDLQRPDPLVIGWWIDRRAGSWFLQRTGLDTILLLGAREGHEVAGRTLLEARLKGVKRLVVVDPAGAILKELDTEAALLDILDRPYGQRIGEAAYEDAFADLYRLLGDRLRVRQESFTSSRALLMVGGLGPGGAERQAAYTAMGLQERGAFEVHIACNHIDPPNDFFRPGVEAAGASIALVPDHSQNFDAPDIVAIRNYLSRYDALGFNNIFHVIFHYATLIRTLQPGVVHTWMDYCNVLAGTAAELVGVPNLLLSGRSVAPDNFRIFQPYMRPGYHALLARRRCLFLNNSRAGAADYARWLGRAPDDFRVIHNGFVFPPKRPKVRARAVRGEYNIPAEATVVGSVMRFAEEKRPQLAIDMARRLYEQRATLRFLYFGSGPMLEEMRAYVARLGLSDVIRLPGLTRDVWSALAAMDVFTLTSRMEGLPNVIVEAQASGLPVVCTGVGGMPETFVDGETGFSVEAATAEALAAAVLRVVDTPGLLAQMSKRAAAHARQEFSLNSMVKHTLKAYEDART